MIELSTLRIFLIAAEEKNFSRTAELLNLSQSAVSQNIQSMERAYGVQLFTRRGRTVELSEAGPSCRSSFVCRQTSWEKLHHDL